MIFSDCNYVEVNGYLKIQCNKDDVSAYKCWYSDQLYSAQPGCLEILYSLACTSDPHGYQVCGQQTCHNQITHVHSEKEYCGGNVCEIPTEEAWTYPYYFEMYVTCNNITQCSNEADEQYCDWNNKVKCSDTYINENQQCDLVLDCENGGDEVGCNHTIGVNCEIYLGFVWLPPYFVCDGSTICINGEDETNCSFYDRENATCHWCFGCYPYGDKAYDEAPRCLHPKQMCGHPTQSICCDHKDQYNCSDPVHTCLIELNLTTLRDINICDGYEACDDGFDEVCEVSGLNCKVHKNRLCDNIKDCERGGDENKQICKQLVNETCLRKVNRGTELKIPLEWLCDNVADCINGVDENRTKWKICGAEDKQRCIEPTNKCEEMLLCPGFAIQSKYVERGELCDSIETCPGENSLCQASHSTEAVLNTVLEIKKVKRVSFCLPGFDPKQDFKCVNGEFRTLETGRVVQPMKMTYPADKQSCMYVYGEQYVYYSCKKICLEKKVACPLRPVKHDSCPYAMKQNIYIPSESQDYLTLIQKDRGHYNNFIFPCDNGNCVKYKQVCDLSDDCGDASDEKDCINNFRCNTTGKFIHKGGLCNGVIECFDRSDECDCGTTKRIINKGSLRVFSWVAGVLATSINGMLLVKNAIFLQRTDSRPPFTNTFLVMLIAIGDLLVGVYLLVIATADYVYSDHYCINEHKWLGSTQCSLTGIFSTIGSQVSLFSMTALSLYRAHSLSHFSAPGDVSLKYKIKMFSIAIFIIVLSVAIAVIPQIPSFEDYFINGLYYPNNPLFVGSPDKSQHIKSISEYHGRVSTKEISWATLRILVADMFTKDNTTVIGQNQGFYSSDGVCLFKYFVNKNDPQKNFSLAILLVNSVCFLIITTCYVTVNVVTVASSQASSSSSANARRLQKKITIIVITDFICCNMPPTLCWSV